MLEARRGHILAAMSLTRTVRTLPPAITRRHGTFDPAAAGLAIASGVLHARTRRGRGPLVVAERMALAMLERRAAAERRRRRRREVAGSVAAGALAATAALAARRAIKGRWL
jgi:hypothetical protein